MGFSNKIYMRIHHLSYIVALLLVILPGCFRRETDVELVNRVTAEYNTLVYRYEPLLNVVGDLDAMVQEVRLVGNDTRLGLFDSWVTGYDDPGVPLHRAIVRIEHDADRLVRNANRLEERLLGGMPIVGHSLRLERDLRTAVRSIQSLHEYTLEKQYLRTKRLQEEQVYQAKRHTELLEKMSQKPGA